MQVAPNNRKITAISKIANYRQSKTAISRYLHTLYAYLLTIPIGGRTIEMGTPLEPVTLQADSDGSTFIVELPLKQREV